MPRECGIRPTDNYNLNRDLMGFVKWGMFYEIVAEVKNLTHAKFNRLPNDGIEKFELN
jgi:hypothetical protein